jgi:N-succinyldiaminopimelate aminotransferase
VVVTAGATEAIAAAILALCEAGDEVVCFEPYYDSYAASIALAGAVRRPVTLRPEGDGYRFDPAELRAAFGPRTRLVLLNSPHNPTGKVFDAAELALVAELCVEHGAVAVTDEVYEHLVFAGEHTPLASLPGMRERTLLISSAGKTFSCTGWKVGWAAAPRRSSPRCCGSSSSSRSPTPGPCSRRWRGAGPAGLLLPRRTPRSWPPSGTGSAPA